MCDQVIIVDRFHGCAIKRLSDTQVMWYQTTAWLQLNCALVFRRLFLEEETGSCCTLSGWYKGELSGSFGCEVEHGE